MAAKSSSDLEIFSASAFFVSAAFFLGGPLFVLARLATDGDPTLFAQLAGQNSLGALWSAFVILPALLAFVAVGLPCLLRYLFRRGRPAIGPWQRVLLLAVTVGAGMAFWGARFAAGWGALGLVVMMLAGLAASGSLLDRHGLRFAHHSLLAGAGALAALAAYELALARGGQPSVALAPTFIVAAAFLLETGLIVLLAYAVLSRTRTVVAAACWGLLVAWYAATANGVHVKLVKLAELAEPVLILVTAASLACLVFYGLGSRDISPPS